MCRLLHPLKQIFLDKLVVDKSTFMFINVDGRGGALEDDLESCRGHSLVGSPIMISIFLRDIC